MFHLIIHPLQQHILHCNSTALAVETLQKATTALKEFGDEYATIEHILLGLIKTTNQVAQILKDNGITEKGLVAAIQDLRKGSKVTTASAENNYNALKKYAIKRGRSLKPETLEYAKYVIPEHANVNPVEKIRIIVTGCEGIVHLDEFCGENNCVSGNGNYTHERISNYFICSSEMK